MNTWDQKWLWQKAVIKGEACVPGDHTACFANRTQNCWADIKNEVFPKCMVRKSCVVQEYGIYNRKEYNLLLGNEMMQVEEFIRNWGGNERVVQALLSQPQVTTLLHISFDYLDWSRGDRTKELELEVLSEYYLWNAFSLVGNVGGQMGLFISFSFIGCFGWLMEHVKKLLKYIHF